MRRVRWCSISCSVRWARRCPPRHAELSDRTMAIPLRPLAWGIARALAFILLIFLLQAAIVSVFATPLRWLDDASHDKHVANGLILLLSAFLATAIMLRSIDVRPW